MKVVIYKSYSKSATLYSNYGDDYEEVWHNFNTMKDIKEMSQDEFSVLTKAVEYFNSKRNHDYTLGLFVVAEDEELTSLISDYKEYEKKEMVKAEKLDRERKAKELANKVKLEARKHERAVKKFAKELNLSEDEVRVILAKGK